MGQIKGLWERDGVRQHRIDALVKEKEQVRVQCDQMATVQTDVQREIGQLKAANDQLQKDNDRLRQELLDGRATPHPSRPSFSSSVSSVHSGLTDRDHAIRLDQDNNRLRGEREALQQDNEKLKSTITELRKDAQRKKIRNDATMDRLLGQLQAAEDKFKQPQGQPQSRLPSHQEMGGHRPYLPTAEGRPSLPTTPGGMQGPPALSLFVSQPAHPGVADSPQIPQLTPQRTASTTLPGFLDPEEAMESDLPGQKSASSSLTAIDDRVTCSCDIRGHGAA